MIKIYEMKQATLADYGITKEENAGYTTYYLNGEKLLDAQEFYGIDNLANFIIKANKDYDYRIPFKNKKDVIWRLVSSYRNVPYKFDSFEFDEYASNFMKEYRNTMFSIVDNISNLKLNNDNKISDYLEYNLEKGEFDCSVDGHRALIVVDLDKKLMELFEEYRDSVNSSLLDKEDWIDAKNNFIKRIPHLFDENVNIDKSKAKWSISSWDVRDELKKYAILEYNKMIMSILSNLGFKLNDNHLKNRNISITPNVYSGTDVGDSYEYKLWEIYTSGGKITRKDLSSEYLGKVFDNMFNELSW